MTTEELVARAKDLESLLIQKGYKPPHVAVYFNWHGSEVCIHISTPNQGQKMEFIHGNNLIIEEMFERAYDWVEKLPMAIDAMKIDFLQRVLPEMQLQAEKLGIQLPVQLAI